MSKHFTEIQVTFEESPLVEIQPITKGPRAARQKRRCSWLDWFR
jgi:hypothetical protein